MISNSISKCTAPNLTSVEDTSLGPDNLAYTCPSSVKIVRPPIELLPLSIPCCE